MQLKQFILSCAGSFLLVFASASYAADIPAEATVNPTPEVAANPPADAAVTPAPEAAAKPPFEAVSNPQPQVAAVVNDPGSVYLIRENPFFWLHIEKSIEHARDAEIAGNMGQLLELRGHAQMSLMQAREAQRAGNVAGLNEGIVNLKKAVEMQQAQASPSSAQGVDPQCIDELERQCGDVQPGSGRIQQCFDDKINNFSSMCQEKLKEGKAAIAAAILGNRHEKAISGTAREEAVLRSSTDFVREARKSLSQAGGMKYKEIQPQVAVSTEK